MRRKVALYVNNSKLGSFLLKKWCAKNHKKYDICLIFENENDASVFAEIRGTELIVLYNQNLIDTLTSKKITDLILLDASKLLSLSYIKRELSKNKISVYIENTDFLKTHLDKYLSNLDLEKNKLPIPKFQLLSEFILNPKIDFPVIIKPNRGYASKNIHKINNKLELELLQIDEKSRKKYLVQEYLRGKEFSCTVVRNEKLRHMSIKRELVNEYTINSRFKKKYNIHLQKWLPYLDNLKFDYALNIQYILTKNGPKIFEINPRLGTAEAHRFEYNFDALVYILSKKFIKKNNFREGTFKLKNIL